MANTLDNTGFIPYPLLVRGKVRNVYDLGETLLMIVTDRISAFDVVFSDLIPDKGRVLNGISEFWFQNTRDVVPNHLVTANASEFPDSLKPFRDLLEGRSMIIRKMDMLKVECIVRGYLEGSGLKEYMKTGTISGIPLPEGLRQCEKLPEPIFTPTTKAEEGHDESVTFARLEDSIGSELAGQLRDLSIALYLKACAHAETRGILLADTKFEFGLYKGILTLGDEVCTPDSSRFWEKADYQPGRAQRSFDKQYLREYLEASGWDKTPPAPRLPEEVIRMTRAKYIEAFERITGRKMD
ncbi:MAG TPA: phosphoribosylaminoimidazolesuccinocarboxamide synthase [Clostridiales bacterium]|nr:phosphoribosylaminoimidazolesuccinocarboxamide synthase [Clostridiales bacterium]